MHDSSSLDLKTAQRLCSAAAAVGMRPVDALAEHAARLRAEGALPPPRKKSRRR